MKIAFSNKKLKWRVRWFLRTKGYKNKVSKYCPVGKVYLLNKNILQEPISFLDFAIEEMPDNYDVHIHLYGMMVNQRNAEAKFTEIMEW